MQREIKFRVYNLSGEFKMLYVNELTWAKHADGLVRMHFGADIEFGENGVSVHSGFGLADGSENYGWCLMQYTGLKDKNGVEIYEDDVVKGYIPNQEDDDDLPFGHVKFAEGEFNIWKGDKYLGELYGCVINKSIEVIGNIYEHSELKTN